MAGTRGLTLGSLTAVVVVLLAAAGDAAALIKPLSLDALIGRSERIFVARVIDLESRWESTRGSRSIFTKVTLNVESTLKGAGEAVTTLRIPGGRVGEIVQVVSTVPHFDVGERTLLFFDGSPARILGGSRGKYTMRGEEVPGLGVTLRDLARRIGGEGASTPVAIRVGPPYPIVISDISPGEAPANIGVELTITGANFGEQTGSGKVEFSVATGWKDTAEIVSWSDTRIVCKLPDFMSSSLVTVANNDLTSFGYPFVVTFAYEGVQWKGFHPVVRLEVNENATGYSGGAGAIRAAAARWSRAGDGRFSFKYAGPTTATEADPNGHNELFWGPVWFADAIAMASVWASGPTGGPLWIYESDIVFNEKLPWGNGSSDAYFDVMEVATHELGHTLGLLDLYGQIGGGDDDLKTMYGFGWKGKINGRTLHHDDIAGVMWLYGAPDGR